MALRGEALKKLQTMQLEDQDDYKKVTSFFETRNGSTYLRQIHSEPKNRNQKVGESLQEYKIIIVQLAGKTQPHLPDGMLEKLARKAFGELRDVKMKQALRLAKLKTLVDALAQALEFEGVQRASKNEGRVRRVKPKMRVVQNFATT